MEFRPPVYEDTDSCKYANKQTLNSIYGYHATNKIRNYICVIVDDIPTVIFKDKIVAVQRCGAKTLITCVGDLNYYAQNSYADVVKMLV